MIKSHKIRIYPTREQERSLWNHIGSCRYIWNYMLSYQKEQYDKGKKHLSAFDMNKLLKPLRNDGNHEWLRAVSFTSLCHICRDLDKAYKSFFNKQSGFPKFKSRKRSKPAYPIRETMYFKDDIVVIEKIGKVRYKTDFTLPQGKAKFTNPRIANANGKWLLSFGMECESQVPTLTDKAMGIDLGVKDLAIAAFDETKIVFSNINKSRRMRMLRDKAKHLQRTISRKYEANKRGKVYIKMRNIERNERKLRQIHTRIANIRNNYIHQTTHSLISLLPCKVVMEDLNVQGMMKNRHLSRAIQEQSFSEFIRQMEYKCEWNDIEFVKANRFYPSSKTCSCCGNVKRNLKLSDRTYVCDVCGAVIDRDYNAAINLSRYVA
jgi:putative transposase